MRNLIYLFIIVFTISCSNSSKEIKFTISNVSDSRITDIKFTNGVNHISIPTLDLGSKKTVKLIFDGVPKLDGGYKFYYRINSQDFYRNFGYYSNGIPLNTDYYLEVKKDTVLISEKE